MELSLRRLKAGVQPTSAAVTGTIHTLRSMGAVATLYQADGDESWWLRVKGVLPDHHLAEAGQVLGAISGPGMPSVGAFAAAHGVV